MSSICWLFVSAFFLGVVWVGNAGSPVHCTGRCVPAATHCQSSQDGTDCAKEKKCCLDEQYFTTLEPAVTTYQDSESSESSIVETETRFRSFLDPETTEESTGSPLSTLVYEEAVDMEPEDTEQSLADAIAAAKCPGYCMPSQEITYCGFPFPFANLCGDNTTCCLTELQAFRVKSMLKTDRTEQTQDPVAAIRKIFQEQDFSDLSELHCPFTCVRQINVKHCIQFYPDMFCPGKTQCCHQRSSPPKVTEEGTCDGHCIPYHVGQLCKPPRLLIPKSDCQHPLLCCTSKQSAEAMDHYAQRLPESFYVEDANKQIFHISESGEITRLESLPSDAQPYHGNYERSDKQGKIWLIPESEDNVWKQHVYMQPEGRAAATEDYDYVAEDGSLYRMAVSEETPNVPDEEIIIPDEEDLPQEKQEGQLVDRPPCPGSCLSYLTRFMCFRNYTTYDGFHCPGRSVCCAKLEDIKQHEENMKTSEIFSPREFRNFNPNCGKKGVIDDSSDSLPGEWCWQVAILDSQNQYVCGGALIDNSWVLATAHCVAGFVTQNHQLFVRVGVTDLTSTEDNAAGHTRRVINTYVHYNYDGTSLDNDIALLKLQNPVMLNTNVCLVCLPLRTLVPPEGTMCTLTGYGFVSRTEGMLLNVKEATIPVIHDLDCISNITEALSSVYILPASSFCAGHEKEYCQAASGNPLVCKIDDHYELTGLHSWGVGCELDETPSIYVKIPELVGWIYRTITADIELNLAMPGGA